MSVRQPQLVSETLPSGWEWKAIGEMVDELQFGSSSKTTSEKVGIPVLRMGNIKGGNIVLDSLKYLPTNHKEFPALLLQSGDLLFNRTNSAELVGKTAVYRGNPKTCSFASYLIRLRLRSGYIPEYLAHYINSTFGRAWIGSVVSQQVGQANVNGTKLKGFLIPVPHISEQQQIVAEIDKQFTRLDAGIAALQRVQANLGRYRAAVLNLACSGHLVPNEAELASKSGQIQKFESGEALLARTLSERRKIKNGRGRSRDPIAPTTENLPPLPIGWTWASPDQVSDISDGSICAGPFGTIFKAHDFRPSGIPIIFLRHVAPGKYLTHKPGFMDKGKWEELFRPYSVYGGELLVTKLGDPPGICAIYPEGLGPAMVTPDVIKMTPNPLVALPKYLEHFFNSQTARNFATGAAFGTTRLRLTIPIFREMPVPLPPIAEQKRIVEEVERLLSVVGNLGVMVAANLKRAEGMRQSILQQAFTGELL